MVRRSTSGDSVDLENVFFNGRVDVRLLFKEDFYKLTFFVPGQRLVDKRQTQTFSGRESIHSRKCTI